MNKVVLHIDKNNDQACFVHKDGAIAAIVCYKPQIAAMIYMMSVNNPEYIFETYRDGELQDRRPLVDVKNNVNPQMIHSYEEIKDRLAAWVS